MKATHGRILAMVAATAAAAFVVTAATAQTTTNLTLEPNYAGLQGTAPLGVSGDAPAGWDDGSWRANVPVGAPSGSNYTSIILDPMTLFGRDDVRVDELARVTYYTKKDAPGTDVDWFFQFYTKPYTGSPGATWYGHRINAEPYFSESLNAPANQWNFWETDSGQDNRLRFYDSSNNYFGSYTDPFLQDLATMTYPIPAWNLNDPYDDLGPQEIYYFNFGLGTGWAGGFDGQIDGITIELTDGSIATVNLEDFGTQVLALNADGSCYEVNDTVTVTIDLTGNDFDEIIGGQFLLSFDDTVLDFASASPASPPSPFTEQIHFFYDGVLMPGYLEYSTGIDFLSGSGTTGDAAMAVLTFTALQEICDDDAAHPLVEFIPSSGSLVTRLTDSFGGEVLPDLEDLEEITIDETPPTFTFEPSNVVVECDESTEPADTGEATASDNCDPAPLVTYDDVITPGACPNEFTITRTWTATDACGNSNDHVQTITVEDTTDPAFVNVPDDVLVYAEAGFCSAIVDVFAAQSEAFDENPDLNEWVVDRFEPACFQSVVFDGDNRLQLCIDAADAQASAFHNTQGRKVDPLPDPATAAQIDLYVPSDWATTNRRMAGFWLDSDTGQFAIVEFNSGSPGFESTSDDPSGAGAPDPRFRAWASSVGWVDMGLPSGFAYDEWHTITIEIDGSNFVYEVGDLSLELDAGGSAYFDAVFIQGYNTPPAFTSGVTYETHWDNMVLSNQPVALDNCDGSPVVTFERSDNAALDLTDPFPAGITTITWTATDACGNSDSVVQTVEVIDQNLMTVDVELQGADSGPFTRCVEFELYDSLGALAATVSETLTFVNGSATAVIEVPCGDYDGCLRARDPLHTLRSTGDLTIAGTEYVADGFLPLRGGDLNDDALIDILDFGVFVFQSNTNPSPGADTDCNDAGPHADISGDGLVTTADFTFITGNFFQLDESCPMPATYAGGAFGPAVGLPQPRARISVRELHRLGLGHLQVADLNNDSMVDQEDIALFASGANP